MNHRLVSPLLGALVGLAGCDSPATLPLTVAAAPAVMNVATLHVEIDRPPMLVFDTDDALSPPRTISTDSPVTLSLAFPDGSTGQAYVTVTALDAAGDPLARAATPLVLPANAATVTLAALPIYTTDDAGASDMGVTDDAAMPPAPDLAAPPVWVDLSSLLNADVVADDGNGAVDATQTPMDAAGDVFATASVVQHHGGGKHDGLPDDGVYPATADHPEIHLAVRNASDGNNTVLVAGAGVVALPVQPLAYRSLQLYFAAGGVDASNPTALAVTLIYGDGSMVTRTTTVNDWSAAPASDQFDVDGNLGRWSTSGTGGCSPAPCYDDTTAVHLVGYELAPDASRTLASVAVAKSGSGNFALFGAAGTAATP